MHKTSSPLPWEKSIKMKGDSPQKHGAKTKCNKQEENTHPPENYGKQLHRTNNDHINNL